MPDHALAGAANAPTLELFGFRFDNVTRAQACRRIADLATRADRFHVVGFLDVALLMRSRQDAYLREYYSSVDALFVDGRGLVGAARLLGRRFVQMASAPFTYYDLMAIAEHSGLRIYLVGATAEVLQRAIDRIRARHPELQIVGSHHGYFDEHQGRRIAEEIARSEADIVVLGMGTPYRERFVDTALRALERGVAMPIGGMIDVEAGITKLAPRIVSVLGIEWLWRVMQEPRRLGPRYLRTHPRFVMLVLQGLIRRVMGQSLPIA